MLQLAGVFEDYYGEVEIIKYDSVTAARMTLIKVSSKIMKACMEIFGIAPDTEIYKKLQVLGLAAFFREKIDTGDGVNCQF